MLETNRLRDNIQNLSNFKGRDQIFLVRKKRIFSVGELEVEPPNNNLSKFEGKLTWNGKVFALKNDNVLLRGTRLRNTEWIIGGKFLVKTIIDFLFRIEISVVCYTGSDTKLMQNSGKPKFKRTKIDHWLNKIILGVGDRFLRRHFFFMNIFVDFRFSISNVLYHDSLLWLLAIRNRL